METKDTVMKTVEDTGWIYTLNCHNCGIPFETEEAFPNPHLCPKCLALFKAGEQQGMRKVVEWIKRNVIYSHEPTCEHIRITRPEWDCLESGVIPPERKHIIFKKENGL